MGCFRLAPALYQAVRYSQRHHAVIGKTAAGGKQRKVRGFDIVLFQLVGAAHDVADDGAQQGGAAHAGEADRDVNKVGSWLSAVIS